MNESTKHHIKWFTPIGSVARKSVCAIGWRLMRIARAMFRWSLGRCCMCGCLYGMQGNITGGGGYCDKCYDRYIKPTRINTFRHLLSQNGKANMGNSRHKIESRISPICMGVQRRVVSTSGRCIAQGNTPAEAWESAAIFLDGCDSTDDMQADHNVTMSMVDSDVSGYVPERKGESMKSEYDKGVEAGFKDGLEQGRMEREKGRHTNFSELSFADKDNLIQQMFDVQGGFVSCRRMAQELILLYERHVSPEKMVRQICDGCGTVYNKQVMEGRPADRPPICCSISCHEKELSRRGRQVA